MTTENKNLNGFAEILSSVFGKQEPTQDSNARILNEAINNIDSNSKLNLLIDTLEQADIKALLKGETITVFRKSQLKRIEEHCASIHFPIHVQPCIDTSLNNIWAYNISKVFDYKRKEDNPQGGRYHY